MLAGSSKIDESDRVESSMSSRREPTTRPTKQRAAKQQPQHSQQSTTSESAARSPPQSQVRLAPLAERSDVKMAQTQHSQNDQVAGPSARSTSGEKAKRVKARKEGEATSSLARHNSNGGRSSLPSRAASPTETSRSLAAHMEMQFSQSHAHAASVLQNGVAWGGTASPVSISPSQTTSSHSHTAPSSVGLAPPLSTHQLAAAHAAAVAAMASSSAAAAFRANSLGGGSFVVPSSPSSSTSSVSSAAPRSAAGQQPPFVFRQPFQPTLSQQQLHQHQHLHHHMTMERERFTASLTNCIIAFLSPILPTEEEYRIKEATRRQLERLTGKVSPGAKLLAFGSMANGFALRNSDMDLCCLIAPDQLQGPTSSMPTNASELVERLGNVLREETDYKVMPLPKARIPIIKISRAPTAELPYEISCDIGFENRLALENTRLLLSYAMVDPPRLRTLVLFLKVWTKRRKLNSPYTGTLSSYGYTLMMIFFLMHVKRPAVLPNLQRISLPPNGKKQDASLNGHNIYFYDDVASLRKEWTSSNTENVGELLLDFFKYFSKEFGYSRDVISIRTDSGVLTKDGKMWNAELCIEDPFQLGYNVARTVTKDGLYTIRGEFMRASRILTSRMDRVSAALAELCEEREDGLTRAPDPPTYQRSRHAATGLTSYAAAAHYNLAPYLASGAFDPRYLRELTRRLEAGGTMTSGFGGSFAFEEMARGLAQAQHNGTAIAFPPTTAMLAALSQNVGLSPRQSVMRAGLRYETPRRNQSALLPATPAMGGDANGAGGGHATGSASVAEGAPHARAKDEGSSSSSTVAATSDDKQNISALKPVKVAPSRLISSARSEDGGAFSRRSKRWNTTHLPPSNDVIGPLADSESVDETMSPRGDDEAEPQRMLHPDTALHTGAYGIGEAFAYGSEISFGTQRFQLYPHPTMVKQRQNSTSGVERSGKDRLEADQPLRSVTGPSSRAITVGGSLAAEPRTARSFSDGLNRSNSVPRPAPLNGVSPAPATSQPPSPRRLTMSRGSTLGDDSAASSSLKNNAPHSRSNSISAQSHASAPADRRYIKSPGERAQTGVLFGSATSSPAPITSAGLNAAPHNRLASQSANGSPYLTPTPWSFFPHPPASSHNLGDDDGSRMSFVHNANGSGGFVSGEASSSRSDTTFSPVPSRQGEFALDDEDAQTRLSDGTMDDSARISIVASSSEGEVGDKGVLLPSHTANADVVHAVGGLAITDDDPTLRTRQEVEPSKVGVSEAAAAALLPVQSKEHDVRSWAASQRVHLDRQQQQHHIGR